MDWYIGIGIEIIIKTCLCLRSISFGMGLLPDTENCRLRMRRECRERFPPPPISKETVS